jgi:hypothetical protein
MRENLNTTDMARKERESFLSEQQSNRQGSHIAAKICCPSDVAIQRLPRKQISVKNQILSFPMIKQASKSANKPSDLLAEAEPPKLRRP